MKTSDPLDGWKPFAQIDVKDPFFDDKSYWGLLPITDDQFKFIIQQSQAHEGFIVD